MERAFSPRFWLGCDFFAWLRIMTRGRFQFSLPHMHIGLCTSAVSVGHTVLKVAQNVLHRRDIERTRIEHPPVFIVGHWRTGTTLLHELLVLDPRHSYLNTYRCLEPNHFLLTESLVKKWFNFLLPRQRPMDKMKVGWDRPQEDEFAMCMLGQPSPYLDLIFPNQPPLTPGALDLNGLSSHQREAWKKAYFRLLQTQTYQDPRRLILKSPPHSCRIPTLLELFPDARFVHIVRNPYKVFPSTVNLWKSLSEKQSVQTPNHLHVEEKVLSTCPLLYAKLQEGKKRVDPSRFHELKYEDLVQDPVGEMRQLYARLQLEDFEAVQPRITDYFKRNAGFEPNHFELTPHQRAEIKRRWGHIFHHYGYPIEPTDKTTLPTPVTPAKTDKDASSAPTVMA